MRKIRVGVVGLGRLGAIHAKIYSALDSVELSSICDIDENTARPIAEALKTSWSSDYKKLLDNKLDAVSVVTPTIYHYEIAKFFLQNKIPVLIEKPITKTLREAGELIKIAAKNKVIIQVGHVERFNSAIQAVEKLSNKPRFIEVHRLGPFTPRVKDVGVVLDLMIHDIDIVLGLTKSKVKTIDALGMKILTDHEDIANARIRFKNGTVCDLTASRVTSDSMRKIRIFQDDCYISIDYMAQAAVIHRKINNQIVSEEIDIKKEAPLTKELASFIDCVSNNKNPLVSGREAYEALKVALDILKKINR
ncbi:MAG: Gfo/Idh/MocA family oxidoreductase [Candidatus Omnitrophota bacterium]|nr:Gfo/Idh/MocA family oxidoreductase [Candidatus Omnitrophota bacterium]